MRVLRLILVLASGVGAQDVDDYRALLVGSR